MTISLLALSSNAQTLSAPTALPASNITPSAFKAKWIQEADTFIYFIDVATDAGFNNIEPGFDNLCLGDNASYILSGFMPGTTYYYRLRVSNGVELSENSNTISVTTVFDVNVFPQTIDYQLTVEYGDSVRFIVQSIGPASFQWYLNNKMISENENIPEVHASTLSISTATEKEIGTYYCIVTTAKGTARSLNIILNVDTYLPVNLLSFDAENRNNVVELNWATVTEFNNDYFTIERSDDGEKYYPVAQISAAGNSNNRIYYSYNDISNDAANSVVYYKLTQTDFDGKSEIIGATSCSLSNLGSNNFEPVIYLSAENTIQISLSSESDQTAQLTIYDLSGRIIVLEKVELMEGNNNFSLNASDLYAGMYVIALASGTDVISEKIMVN